MVPVSSSKNVEPLNGRVTKETICDALESLCNLLKHQTIETKQQDNESAFKVNVNSKKVMSMKKRTLKGVKRSSTNVEILKRKIKWIRKEKAYEKRIAEYRVEKIRLSNKLECMRNSIGHKTKNIEQLEKEIEAKKQTLAVVHNLLLNEAKAEAHGVGIDQNNIYSRRYSSIIGSSKYNGKSSKRNQTSKETRSYQKQPNNIHQNGSTRSMPLNAKQEMRNLNVQSNDKTEICYNCTKQQLLTRDMIRIITHLSCLSDEALANEKYFAKIFFYNMSREEPEPYKSKSLTAAVDNCQLILNSLKNKIGQRVNDLLTMEYWCTDNIDVQIKDLTSFYLDTSVFGTIYENSQDYLKNKANTQKSKFVKGI